MGESIQAKRMRPIVDDKLVGENMVSQSKVGENKTGENKILQITVLLALLLLATPAAVQNLNAGKSGNGRASQAPGGGQLHIANRASTPLFKGQQGKQKTEIHFDPATRMVTVKLLVQDANGYFIPNIRRDNFVVYENGVRQQNAAVEIEHAPVKIGLLMEFGGRAQALNRTKLQCGNITTKSKSSPISLKRATRLTGYSRDSAHPISRKPISTTP
jgi:hypothetical protein